jgi:hypothetical protein
MAAKNDITGDDIKSKALSEKGRANWDNIFKKQSAWDWLKELGYNENTIIDPDGWRYDDVTMDTPISRSDFFNRFNQSTVMTPFPTNHEN